MSEHNGHTGCGPWERRWAAADRTTTLQGVAGVVVVHHAQALRCFEFYYFAMACAAPLGPSSPAPRGDAWGVDAQDYALARRPPLRRCETSVDFQLPGALVGGLLPRRFPGRHAEVHWEAFIWGRALVVRIRSMGSRHHVSGMSMTSGWSFREDRGDFLAASLAGLGGRRLPRADRRLPRASRATRWVRLGPSAQGVLYFEGRPRDRAWPAQSPGQGTIGSMARDGRSRLRLSHTRESMLLPSCFEVNVRGPEPARSSSGRPARDPEHRLLCAPEAPILVKLREPISVQLFVRPPLRAWGRRRRT